jgi:hypothetical protein
MASTEARITQFQENIQKISQGSFNKVQEQQKRMDEFVNAVKDIDGRLSTIEEWYGEARSPASVADKLTTQTTPQQQREDEKLERQIEYIGYTIQVAKHDSLDLQTKNIISALISKGFTAVAYDFQKHPASDAKYRSIVIGKKKCPLRY